MRLGNVTIAAALAMAVAPGSHDADTSGVELPDARILALSPDGQLLAASTGSENRPAELCVYDVATMAEQACADLDGSDVAMYEDSVVWSPDSTTLAFSEDAFITLVDGDLWVMDAATGELTNLTDDGFEGGLPVLGDDEQESDQPIYVDVLPAWAPDSQSIAFSSSPVIGGEFRGNDVASVDLESGEVDSIVPVTPDVAGVVYWGLTWAPDGERLYYSVTYPDVDNAQNGVWEYDTATGESTQILENDPDTGPPALLRVAATGTTGLVIYPLYWSSQLAGEHEYFALLDLESGAVAPVGPSTGDTPGAAVQVATFSPDGTQVLYGQPDGDGGRFFVRDLPAGKPVELDPELDTRPYTTTMGGGIFWASDGTVFVASDPGEGTLLHAEP